MIGPGLDGGVQLDLLDRAEESEGPPQPGGLDGDDSVLVRPDVIEGVVLGLGSLDRFVGVGVDRRPEAHPKDQYPSKGPL